MLLLMSGETVPVLSPSPSVSLEKEEETEVVVLGVRPRTLSDSRRVFLLAGPLLTRV